MERLFQRGAGAPATTEALRVRHELLERLSRIQRSISHGAPLEEVFAAIAAGAAELLGDPVAGLRLIDAEDPTSMRLMAVTGLSPEQAARVEVGVVGQGAGGRAITENRVVVVEAYGDAGDAIAQFAEYGVHIALAAPIRLNGRVCGSLTVASFEAGRRYDEVEQEVLSALAEHAGLALMDANLIDRRERQVERQGEERFQTLIRHSSDLIAVCDVAGRMSFATPSVARTLRVPVEGLEGTNLLAHVHPGDRPRAAQMLRDAAAAPREATLPPSTWRLVPPGRHFRTEAWRHLEVLATNLIDHPTVSGIVLNARDVTERLRAERTSRERDARYRQIVDTTHDGVWMTDPDDRTVFANEAMAKMLGVTVQELDGSRPADFMEASQAAVVAAAMARRRRGVHERYEVTLRRADGAALHLVLSASPIFEDGRFTGSLALCADITELVRAREVNAQLEHRLRQAQDLELLGTLAGQVAHDFNQVLAVIIGYTDLLRPRVPADLGDELGYIAQAAEHGAALAQQLVSFSRHDAGEPEVLDLAAVVAGVARLVSGTAPAGVTVRSEVDGPLTVRMDPTRLRQVVMNLVDNAFDALVSGGELALRACRREDGEVELVVADDGAGMAPDVVARALEPAFTTKPAGQGTGLGLAIVHGVVHGAGGRLSLRSAAGEGTTVEIVLPAAVDEPAGPSRPASGPAAPTILLVDDDAGVLEVTRRVLADRGYRVLAVADPAQAPAIARREPVDLLLTDQALPGSTGIELAEAVAAIRPGTPVIVMSGYVAETAANRASGIAWLQKPFGAATLLSTVADALTAPSPGHQEADRGRRGTRT